MHGLAEHFSVCLISEGYLYFQNPGNGPGQGQSLITCSPTITWLLLEQMNHMPRIPIQVSDRPRLKSWLSTKLPTVRCLTFLSFTSLFVKWWLGYLPNRLWRLNEKMKCKHLWQRLAHSTMGTRGGGRPHHYGFITPQSFYVTNKVDNLY